MSLEFWAPPVTMCTRKFSVIGMKASLVHGKTV